MVALCPGFKLDHTYWRDGVSEINRVFLGGFFGSFLGLFFLGLNRIFIGNGLTVSLEDSRSCLHVCVRTILWRYTVLKFRLPPKRQPGPCLLAFLKSKSSSCEIYSQAKTPFWLTALTLKSSTQSCVVFWILSSGVGCLGETSPEIRVSPRRFEALQLNMGRRGCVYTCDLFGDTGRVSNQDRARSVESH